MSLFSLNQKWFYALFAITVLYYSDLLTLKPTVVAVAAVPGCCCCCCCCWAAAAAAAAAKMTRPAVAKKGAGKSYTQLVK